MSRLTLAASVLIVMHIAVSGLSVMAAEPSAQQRKFFETKIRPVLVEHCYECHSSDSNEIGGKLRIDSRGGMITGGESGPVFVAGHPDDSLLIQALRYDDLDMPPDGPLPETVVNDFVKWVSLGAHDPRESDPRASVPLAESIDDPESVWSFFPRRVPTVPREADSDWPRDPIDCFVQDRWRDARLSPARDADPETLIRRLSYDLIGLPPTMEQVDAFVAEYRSDGLHAVERLVDSLLENPQFGVRWGRHWLDVARYGESNGDDGLGRNATFPHAWRYRDYVIDALNRDVPYDRFLTEQIAGDLLPAQSAEQRNRQLTATGFLAIGSKPAVAMNNNFAMDVVDDQINVVCTTVMGLSVACARCHDHKHDPIPTRDYYAMAGIFNSTQTLYGAAAKEKLTAPPTPLHELVSTWDATIIRPDRTATPVFPESYSGDIERLKPNLYARLDVAPTEQWVAKSISGYSSDEFAAVKEASLAGEFSVPLDSYSVSFWFRSTVANDSRPIAAYLFSRAKPGDRSLRGLHLGIGGSHDKQRTGKLFVFNGKDSKQSFVGTTVIARDTWNHIVLVRRGKKTRVFLNGRLEINKQLDSTFGDSPDFRFASRNDDFAPLQGNIGHVAVFEHAISDDDAIGLHSASGQPRGRDPIPAIGFAMGVREKAKPADCKIHVNGESRKLGPLVPRGVLTAHQSIRKSVDSVHGTPVVSGKQSGRMELVRWLTSPDHPQTARVMVNRVWLHLFGKGIVTTPDDFGVYGARPTHPELLDHIAERFVGQGWSIKQLIRTLVLTRTYQLASQSDEDMILADPDNVWLARHARRRLDAESLRDSMLKVSGQLDFSPQQGSAVETIDALINWPPGESTNLHRESLHRSVYLCMLRHSPPPELAAFDLPDAVKGIGRRDVTTLPTQALFLLNSDFVVQQSSWLADRVRQQHSDAPRRQVQAIFVAVFQRHATDVEISRSVAYIHSIRDSLFTVADPAKRRQLAWASFCQALLTTNEFRYVD